MFYENELRFLCETFKKSHVRASVISPTEPIRSVMDTDLWQLLGKSDDGMTVRQFLGELEPQTRYRSIDGFKLCYLYLLLPTSGKQSILLIGPYLSEPMPAHEVLELGERIGLSPKSQRYLSEYYEGIPVLPPSGHLFLMLDTFCERIWESPSFPLVDVNQENLHPVSPLHETTHTDHFDDLLVNMKAMELRYAFENELMQAVTLGQIHKEGQLLAAFSDQAFEKRLADPLRNAKNYSIIMNTLLRKAAEAGGVHPVYLDKISSGFAQKIEQLSSLSDNRTLMMEMFRSYCRLVRKHSMKSFSPLIQKTVLLIDSDLSANLTLHSLANSQKVSAGYLSTLFKKETGKTVSEYIRERRVKHASHLLTTTRLQVQTVALHCGIMDVQYFSKIFKRQTGKTPKEYRESYRQEINPGKTH